MKTLTSKDLPKTDELDDQALSAVQGGMINLHRYDIGGMLTNQLGDPVAVYVDGLLINSVTTGYAPR